MKKYAVVYHSRDLDGWMSAAIYMYYKGDYSDTDFFGWDYGEKIPVLKEYEKVYLLDISFDLDNIIKLLYDNNKVTIIDHHKSSKYLNSSEYLNRFSNLELFFSDEDNPKAACELTWEYFLPKKEMPYQVLLLGMYDSFRHVNSDMEWNVKYFQYACRSYFSSPEDCLRLLYYDLGNVNIKVEQGRTIYDYLVNDAKITYKKGFDFVYEGKKFIVFNKERFNLKNFGIDYGKDGYDGIISFYYNKDRWSFSFYSDYIDVSKIAEKFGGGGHEGAAGIELQDYTEFFNCGKIK